MLQDRSTEELRGYVILVAGIAALAVVTLSPNSGAALQQGIVTFGALAVPGILWLSKRQGSLRKPKPDEREIAILYGASAATAQVLVIGLVLLLWCRAYDVWPFEVDASLMVILLFGLLTNALVRVVMFRKA